jgi:hypothetical protein
VSDDLISRNGTLCAGASSSVFAVSFATLIFPMLALYGEN